jgi:hypothetical protein
MRDVNTYRSERRNLWRSMRVMPWEVFNLRQRGVADPWHIGSFIASRVTMGRRPRSKYLPHESVKRGGKGPVFA